MNCFNVKLRELKLEDAEISWRWRNNPEIWRHTGSAPTRFITQEIESKWLAKTLEESNSFRFAICAGKEEKYVGNIQLTGVDQGSGEFHIFIGDTDFWGCGVATAATKLLLEKAPELGVSHIYLHVKMENTAAIKVYEKCGFHWHGDKMTINLETK